MILVALQLDGGTPSILYGATPSDTSATVGLQLSLKPCCSNYCGLQSLS